MVKTVFYCNYGDHMVTYEGPGPGAGYATMSKGGTEKVCYDCAANQDRDIMVSRGRMILYLTGDTKEVINWPGTLRFPVTHHVVRGHNWGIDVIHVWFEGPDGHIWHGTCGGKCNEVCHCKRTAKMWRK